MRFCAKVEEILKLRRSRDLREDFIFKNVFFQISQEKAYDFIVINDKEEATASTNEMILIVLVVLLGTSVVLLVSTLLVRKLKRIRNKQSKRNSAPIGIENKAVSDA